MVEIQVPIQIGNDNARAARREIKAFLAYVNEKQAGDRPDRHDTATQAYVTLRTFLELVTREIARQDAATERANRPATPTAPTTREQRGR